MITYLYQGVNKVENIDTKEQEVQEIEEKGEKRRKILENNKDNSKTSKKVVVISCAVILVLVIVFTVISIINKLNNNIFSGVKFEGIDLSGMTISEADKVLTDYANAVYNRSVVVYQNDKVLFEVTAEDLGLKINTSVSQKEIAEFARQGNVFENNFNVMKAWIVGEEFKANYECDIQKVAVISSKLLSQVEGAVVDDTYTVNGNKLIITKGKTGLDIDKDIIIQDLTNIIMGSNGAGKVARYDIGTAERGPKTLDVDVVYAEVHKEAKDAKADETTTPPIYEAHENGIDFDKEELREVLSLEENKVEGKIIEFELTITEPSVKLSDLKWELYSDLLGTYSTTFSTAASYANRNTNIRVSSEYINGTIVMPGETFSFNKTVGDCGLASRGFKMATVYSGGKVEQGMGGGVCQVSSTLYNAVIYANLEIVQRDNHGYTVSYVDCSRDATIYYPYIDFKFKNTREYPIKIVAEYNSAGKITFSIYGTKEDDEYEVAIESYILTRISKSTTYVNDNTIEKGKKVQDIVGQDGFTSIAYKVLKKDGKVVSKTVLSSDTYSPMNDVIKVGTKEVVVSPYNE